MSFSQPSLKFEEQNRIQGLAYQYILPSGLLPIELNEYVLFASLTDQGVYKRLNEVWKQLKKDNEKTLWSLKFDTNDTRQLYNAILGVASAFLPQDIQFYLDGGKSSTLREDREIKFLLDKIERCLNNICWVPCLDTLRLIDQQIDDKRNSVVQKDSTESSLTCPPVVRTLKDDDGSKSVATSSVTGNFSPQR